MDFDQIIEKVAQKARESEEKVFVVAIDGPCCSGKTFFAEAIAETLPFAIYGMKGEAGPAAIIHMDDFFLPPELRTPERYAEPGGNIDYERFEDEVLHGLRKPRGFYYGRFDCSKMDFGEDVHVPALGEENSGTKDEDKQAPAIIRVVEGCYSFYPRFGDYADFRIFIDVSPEEQLARLSFREPPEKLADFKEKWIPLENRYFEEFNVRERADLIL